MYEVLRRSEDDIIFASNNMPIRDVERYDTRLEKECMRTVAPTV